MKLSMKAGLLAAVVMGMVSGCGGGGGGTVATPVVVSGTAATGAAIAAGSVTLKCVSGTSTAVTTGTDGSFSIDVSAVTLPCVGRVDYKDAAGAAQKLHTFISAAGVANITPVTDLLVASLTSGAAADAFDKFDATKAKGYTAALVKAAAAVVKAYLKNTLGVDTTNLPDDPVGTKLVAKSGSVTGDAFDKVLDDLKAKLATAGKTLVGAASELGSSGTGGTGSIPAVGTFIVSAASNAARNGTYVLTGSKFTSGTDVGFNGSTADGKFEVEAVVSASGVVKRAHIWFFDAGSVIKFFGCDGAQAVPCPTSVGYEPLLKQILFSTAPLAEVNPNLQGTGPDALIGGGETLKVQGSLDVK